MMELVVMRRMARRKTTAEPTTILDRFLLSDRAPPDSMGLSDLDGFLTGIVIGPELIMPSEWMPVVWGGDSPRFRNTGEADRVLSALMGRYNEIVQGFNRTPPSFAPIFWEAKDGTVIAADWAAGFHDAIMLRHKAWKPLFDHQKGLLLKPILILCGEIGDHLDPEVESELMDKATEQIVDSIFGIYAFWKGRP
jgi:uncharacterized protein